MKLTTKQAQRLRDQVNELLESDTFVLVHGNVKDGIHVLSNGDKKAIRILSAYAIARVEQKGFGAR